ncbi:hypothetical protein MJA45_20320 [Paenibacillus aurantius]|uniref:Sporulation membrane protein YtrI C-terminal domain-containing protein n=1 Tax=Paenibacillus aurantius TaxID=2918900 RepID=A0AA96LB70_9BACL|nr:hypothetical protein [Paenibacillus aurantius]WNQ09948.1 hypothetical protein MJA45_20320 [Paenibacillus aurantius]
MRVPPSALYRKWVMGAGLFMAGAIVGAAVFLSLMHHNFSVLSIQNHKLKEEMEKLNNEIKQQTGSKQKPTVISKITVNVEPYSPNDPIDDLSLTELKTRIHKDLLVASGKPVSAVKQAPGVFMEIVNGNIYQAVRDRNYEIRVKTMAVIQNELIVWTTARKHT